MLIGELHITIWDDFDAEDTMDDALADEGLLRDLVTTPIERAIADYLERDYGRLLDVDVEIVR